MLVKVVDRSSWGTPGPYPIIREVKISNMCPKCGGLRGKPSIYNFCEDGDSYSCHKWENPCGHIDMYDDILEEAQNDNS